MEPSPLRLLALAPPPDTSSSARRPRQIEPRELLGLPVAARCSPRPPSTAPATSRPPTHPPLGLSRMFSSPAAAERRGACGEREEPSPAPTPLSIRRRSSRRRSRVLLPLPSRNPSLHQVVAIVLLEEELIRRGSRYSTSHSESLAPWRPAPADFKLQAVDFAVRHLPSSVQAFANQFNGFSRVQSCITPLSRQHSANTAPTNSQTTWTMCATFPEYMVALTTVVGSVFFIIFGGVGIAYLPLGLIFSFFRRPKAAITHPQYIKEATKLGMKDNEAFLENKTSFSLTRRRSSEMITNYAKPCVSFLRK